MSFLKDLGIADINPGACTGPGEWIETPEAGVLSSICPASGEVIASVNLCSVEDYETVIERSRQAFKEWRMVPAPRRGEVVRGIAEVLREKKDALGTLVALESGKIKQEGDGEVQEMIDIADFAVGQSRMLYGHTMHSECPSHRMYEQWHPLGVIGIITAFNFPVAVWSWNAMIAAVCGDTMIWKPSELTPLTALAVQRLIEPIVRKHGA